VVERKLIVKGNKRCPQLTCIGMGNELFKEQNQLSKVI